MSNLPKDARGFVDGIVDYLKNKKEASTTVPKLKKLLAKVTKDNSTMVTAHVDTAVSLTVDEAKQISKALSKLVGRPIFIESHIKPEIIAGIRVRIADWIVDMTYEQTVQTMAQLLKE